MGRGRKLGTVGIAIATAVVGSGVATAQVTEGNSSPVITLDLGTEFRVDDNKDLDPVSRGTTTSASELFTLSVLSETRNQMLSFVGTGGLELEDDPVRGSSTNFVDPSVRLAYSRDSSNAQLGVSAYYREADVNDDILDENLLPEDLITDPGTLRTYGADVELSYGLSGPLGFTVYARTNVRDYSATRDPDLNDNSSDVYRARVDVRASPVTEISLNIERNDYQEQGGMGFDREKTSYSVSASHELRQALTFSGDLGYSQTKTTEAGESPDYESIFGGVSLQQGLRNGFVTAGLSFEERSNDSDRVSVNLGREMELRDGALSYGLTVTSTDQSDLSLLGSLDYTRELKTGSLSVFLDQSIVSNNNDNDEQLSRLALNYQHQINSVSTVALAMDVSQTGDAGGNSTNGRTRANLSATYSRELTADWDLNVGYERRQYKKEGEDSAESNAVFMSLTRGFSLGF